jgi:hypothetical protein
VVAAGDSTRWVEPSAAASQTCENALFLVMSTRLTTNATVEPSGDTAAPA